MEGYNLQVAVESSSGIVVAALATNAANDASALAPLLDAAKAQSGRVPETLVADKGYETPANLAALEKRRVTSVVCPKARKAAPFKPDESGELKCLAGHAPTVISATKDGVEYAVYRVSRCRGWPLKEACGAGKGHQREMAVKAGEESKETIRRRGENFQRCRSEAGKELLRIRGATVERTFAYLKRDMGLRRLLTAGKAGARLELLLACIALNLRTLLRLLLGYLTPWKNLVNAILCIWTRVGAVPTLLNTKT